MNKVTLDIEPLDALRQLAEILNESAEKTLEMCADDVLVKFGGTLQRTVRVLNNIRAELVKTPHKELATPIVGEYNDQCPNCGGVVERWLCGCPAEFETTRGWSDPVQYEMTYCCECGQKLMWED